VKRKDGQPKARARRNFPNIDGGLRDKHPRLEYHGQKGRFSVVSMFAGCGGMDLGFLGGFTVFGQTFRQHPFKIVAAYDNLGDAVETYRLNLGEEIENLDLATAEASKLPAVDVLLGGFPCQDFSSSGPKTGLGGERGQLYTALVRYMREHRPKVVIGENVPHLGRLSGGKYLERILDDFEAEGYSFRVWDIHCPSYGLPQSRRRLFLVGVRNDLSGFPHKPEPTHASSHLPIDQALMDLEAVEDEKITNQSQYFIASRATSGGGQGDHTNRRGEVAYCIRANSRGRIQFHYALDRRLTVRECARLQSFPDDFAFPFTTQRNLTLIGNAVPPIIAHLVAGSVLDFLRGKTDTDKSGACDFRSNRSVNQLELWDWNVVG
jgi:DNA (cytosine-5)-methyltransferase 1